ncbi:MAG: prepilin-type N-terminal cleavage/methylation domain-containing protein [Oscillospiraceae bacterium]|nr:prepilin-type N-terminal cleavage/methylation domain-containing protein [Oscillospiraceae bacterium]
MNTMKCYFYKTKSTTKGFTLIELIVVIAIIVVTSAILVPNIIGQRRMAKIQSANDGAYNVYVAAQDYLNHLQKYGRSATEYFGRGPKDIGDGIGGKEAYVGFLSVNGGVLQSVNTSYAFKPQNGNSGTGHVNKGTMPTQTKQEEAFAGIVKRMGRDVVTKNDTEEYSKYSKALSDAGVAGMPLSPEMNGSGESFLIEVYPDKYTVRCVYYTTYSTERKPRDNGKVFTGYGTDDIFKRVYGAHYDIVCDDGSRPSWNCVGFRGFDSTSVKGGSNLSQERVAERAGFSQMGDTYAPAYVGQYPIPTNRAYR